MPPFFNRLSGILSVQLEEGDRAFRAVVRDCDRYRQRTERKDIIRHTTEGQILITSYDLLKRDVEYYKNIVFAVQVIDEAQYIKNAGTQAAKGVKKITAVFKLAADRNPDREPLK